MIYSKTLEIKDYASMPEMQFAGQFSKNLRGLHVPYHQHRNWEYGLCLNALKANGAQQILEINGGKSIFAASAAWGYGIDVTLVDPDPFGAELIARQNLLLQLFPKQIHYVQQDFSEFKSHKKYDAVVCLSILEHIQDDESYFRRLLGFVKEDGILAITIDFHPSGQKLQEHHLRTYNQGRLSRLIDIAKMEGFDFFGGNPDYSWVGENAYTYNFASLVLKRKKREALPVIFLANQKKKQCGVYQYGKRAADALKRSKKYQFIHADCDSSEEFWGKVEALRPRGIIYNNHLNNMHWLNGDLIAEAKAKGIFQVSIFHEMSMAHFDTYIPIDPDFPETEITFQIPRPLFEYENPYPLPKIPVINSFGFGYPHKGYTKLAKLVNQEFDHAILNFHIPFNDFDQDAGMQVYAIVNACRDLITKPGIEFHVSHGFLSDPELLDFLAKGSMSAFFYDYQKGRGCSAAIDFALSVKRPIAITKSNMFRHIWNAQPGICVEDRSLKEIMASGFTPLEPYYEKWKPSKYIEAFEKIIESLM